MKLFSLTSIDKLFLGIVFALVASIGQSALAQSASDLNEGFQSNEASSTYGAELGGGFNPMQLIHQMNLSNGVSDLDFYVESQKNINSAADEFKRQQQERMLQQSPTNTAVPIEENNNLGQ
jgi:hypothetical protein